MSEDLNINNAIGELIVKALNKFRYKRKAALSLGVSEPQIYRFIKAHKIELVKDKWIKNNKHERQNS